MWLATADRVNLEAIIGVSVRRACRPLSSTAVIGAVMHGGVVAVAWHFVDSQRVSVLAAR